jgi:hypothetical protein
VVHFPAVNQVSTRHADNLVEPTVQFGDLLRAGLLMKRVNVLGDYVRYTAKAFSLCQSEMASVGLCVCNH